MGTFFETQCMSLVPVDTVCHGCSSNLCVHSNNCRTDAQWDYSRRLSNKFSFTVEFKLFFTAHSADWRLADSYVPRCDQQCHKRMCALGKFTNNSLSRQRWYGKIAHSNYADDWNNWNSKSHIGLTTLGMKVDFVVSLEDLSPSVLMT